MDFDLRAFLDASWFLTSEALLRVLVSYRGHANILLRRRHVVALDTLEWRFHHAVPFSCFGMHPSRWHRERWMHLKRLDGRKELVYASDPKIRWMSGDRFCVTKYLDLRQPRCMDELPYIQERYNLQPLVHQWQSLGTTVDVHSSAVCCKAAILPSGYARPKKSSSHSWADTVFMKRRYLSGYGHFAMWHNTKLFCTFLRRSHPVTSLFRRRGGIGKFPLNVRRSWILSSLTMSVPFSRAIGLHVGW